MRWLLAAALALAGVQAQAAIVGASGTLSAGTRSFEMFAGEGYISMADGVQIYSWGYGASTASGGTGLMQISGPTLLVQQGETVSISFTNKLPTRSSMLFPGQVGVTASGGNRRRAGPGGRARPDGDLHLHRGPTRHVPVPERHRSRACRSRWAWSAR